MGGQQGSVQCWVLCCPCGLPHSSQQQQQQQEQEQEQEQQQQQQQQNCRVMPTDLFQSQRFKVVPNSRLCVKH